MQFFWSNYLSTDIYCLFAIADKATDTYRKLSGQEFQVKDAYAFI